VEVGTHDIVVVASEHGDADARLPVPDANSLVVGSRENPRMLVMKLNGANVVEMAEQREEATTLLVIPQFDFVVVTTRNEKWLRVVKTNATNGACSEW
jgi:hypothetical protein